MAQATSKIYAAQAPLLKGVWIHDPANAADTVNQFLYGNVGRTESLKVESTAINYVGRALPVYDYGQFESQEIGIDIVIPYGPDQMDLVDWFRRAMRSRVVLCYRDNRGRKAYGIMDGISVGDVQEGTSISSTFRTADYNEAA